MATVTPLLDDFLSAARSEFSFLSSDFGYEEASALSSTKNQYAVKFVNGKTAVLVEGINWGFAVNVLVSVGAETAPLWAIAKAQGYLAEPYPPGQLAQLKFEANRLREVARDLLRGNASALAPALKVVAETTAQRTNTGERRLP